MTRETVDQALRRMQDDFASLVQALNTVDEVRMATRAQGVVAVIAGFRDEVSEWICESAWPPRVERDKDGTLHLLNVEYVVDALCGHPPSKVHQVTAWRCECGELIAGA